MPNASSFPERVTTDVDPHKLSARGNIMQASRQVNRFARKDPALYPLSAIIVGIACVTGYFAMNKVAEGGDERRLTRRGLVQPWDDTADHDLAPGQVAQFKYRYKTRDGHMEDAMPTMNVDIRKVQPGEHKYKTG